MELLPSALVSIVNLRCGRQHVLHCQGCHRQLVGCSQLMLWAYSVQMRAGSPVIAHQDRDLVLFDWLIILVGRLIRWWRQAGSGWHQRAAASRGGSAACSGTHVLAAPRVPAVVFMQAGQRLKPFPSVHSCLHSQAQHMVKSGTHGEVRRECDLKISAARQCCMH